MRQKNSIHKIAERAAAIAKRCGTRDPAEICDAMQINLYYLDLRRKLKAYYFYHSRISSIVIDENVVDIYRRILIAHELGHHVLHRQTAMMRGFQEMEVLEKRDSTPMETEANLFAAELLLEDEQVLKLLNEYTFFETASILEVPSALLDFKFFMLQKCKGCTLAPLGLGSPDFLKYESEAYVQTPVK